MQFLTFNLFLITEKSSLGGKIFTIDVTYRKRLIKSYFFFFFLVWKPKKCRLRKYEPSESANIFARDNFYFFFSKQNNGYLYFFFFFCVIQSLTDAFGSEILKCAEYSSCDKKYLGWNIAFAPRMFHGLVKKKCR